MHTNNVLNFAATKNKQSQTSKVTPRRPYKACSELVTIALLLTLALSSLDVDFFIVLLECCQIFTRLGELSLFHTLPGIPVHERALRVHQVELVVNAREHFGDGCGVADHANGTHDLRQVTTWDDCRWLIIDATLEACRAPVHPM